MYAFVDIGKKQFKVTEGMTFEVLTLGKKVGETVEFVPVFCCDDTTAIADKKKLASLKVVCQVVEEKQGKKIYSFQKKAKTGYKKGVGNRDHLTVLKVERIGKEKK